MATDVTLPEGFVLDGVEPDLAALEEKHGLPKGLLSAIQGAENSGDRAVSPKGAKGRFQFMPATAKAYGLTDPTDPVASADAAARYMADAIKTYGTTDPRVLAAEYNGGPTQAKAVLAGKAPPAAETQKYIAKVASVLGVGDASAAAPPKSGDLPDGFVLDSETPALLRPKRSFGDILASGGAAPAPAGSGSISASPDRSAVLLNAAKMGFASVPGMFGSVEALKDPVKALVNRKLGIEPGGVVDTLDKLVGAVNPLNAIEGVIRAGRQAMGQETKTAFPTSEELATKFLGYDKNIQPVFDLDKKLARGTEFAASMALGPASSVARGMLKEAGRGAADALALSGAAAVGGDLAEKAGANPVVGELGSIVPYALLRRYFNPKQNVGAAKEALVGEGTALNELFTKQAEAQLQKGVQEYSPAVANIKEAVGLQNKVNETLAAADDVSRMSLSAGQASGAPRTIADELAARKSSTASIAASLNTDAQNTKAILSYISNDADPGVMSRRLAIKDVIDKHNTALADVRAQEQEVRQGMADLAERLTPKMTAEERGSALVGLREQEQAKEKAVTQQLYGAAKSAADAAGAKFGSSAIEAEAARLANNPILAYDSQNLPQVVRNIRGTIGEEDSAVQAMKVVSADKADQLRQRLAGAGLIKDAGKKDALTFDDITAMRQAVNQDIAGELASTNPNKRQRLRALTEMKNTIDGSIAESSYDDVKRLYGAANDYYRTTYAPKFNKGINAKLAMTDSFGQQRVLDEKVLDQYMGSSNGANQFVTLFGKNPEALGVMEDHIIDRYAKAAVKNGVLDTTAAARFVGKNMDVLNKFKASGLPTISKLSDARVAAQTLADREATLTMRGKELAKNDLTNALGTTEHEVIVLKAMSDPYAMLKLTKALGEDGSKSLASSILRDVGSKFTYSAESGKLGIDHAAFAKWLNDNQQSLKIMLRAGYGPKEGAEFFQRLKDANRLLAIQQRVPRVSQKESESMVGKDPLLQRVGVSFRSMFNMLRAIKQGRTSEADAAVALGGQAGSFLMTKQYNALVQRMMSDPESSKYLLALAQDGAKKTLTKDEVSKQAKIIASTLGKLGYIYSGGRYYGPSMRAMAPVMVTQQAQGVQGAVER